MRAIIISYITPQDYRFDFHFISCDIVAICFDVGHARASAEAVSAFA